MKSFSQLSQTQLIHDPADPDFVFGVGRKGGSRQQFLRFNELDEDQTTSRQQICQRLGGVSIEGVAQGQNVSGTEIAAFSIELPDDGLEQENNANLPGDPHLVEQMPVKWFGPSAKRWRPKVEDVLARGTRALLLDARASIEAAPAVAEIMAAKLGSWNRGKVSKWLPSTNLPPPTPWSDLPECSIHGLRVSISANPTKCSPLKV